MVQGNHRRIGWTEKGWFGYTFQHITLCPIYFGLDSLEEKFEMIGKALARGDTTYAEIADWQKNKGQYFLHEMMHLDAVGQPHSKKTLTVCLHFSESLTRHA